jgi:hypothetical protein
MSVLTTVLVRHRSLNHQSGSGGSRKRVYSVNGHWVSGKERRNEGKITFLCQTKACAFIGNNGANAWLPEGGDRRRGFRREERFPGASVDGTKVMSR